MSCYIMDAGKIQDLTAAVIRILDHSEGQFILADAFDPARKPNKEIDPHKLYRMLYIQNLKAYEGRYNEECRDFPKYTGIPKYIDWNEVYNTFREYNYQCAEDPVYGNLLYKAMCFIQNEIANIIMSGNQRYV